ncbi:MAG: hypothetical protein ACT4TC_10015 [Myxococcaceae bacterium]
MNAARPDSPVVKAAADKVASLDFPEGASPRDVKALARELVARTINRTGTNEAFVNAAFELSHLQGSNAELNEEVGKLLRAENPELLEQAGPEGYLRYLIDEELEGSEAKRALDFLEAGKDRFRGTDGENFAEGMVNPFDRLGDAFHDSPVKTAAIAGGAVAAGVTLAAAAPAVAATVGLGFLAYEVASLGKDGFQAATASSIEERAKHLVGAGSHATGAVLSAPSVLATNVVRGAAGVAREEQRFLPAVGRFVKFRSVREPAAAPTAVNVAGGSARVVKTDYDKILRRPNAHSGQVLDDAGLGDDLGPVDPL